MPRSVVERGRRQHLSAAELLERGLRLQPGLVARQQEAERLRRLPETTMQEFHGAGILRMIQPAAFGGFEADFICQIDLTHEIARSCGASGRVYAVLSAHAAMIANFSERAQQEVWGDLMEAAELVKITERIAACRDPKDDKLLQLAVNGVVSITSPFPISPAIGFAPYLWYLSLHQPSVKPG